MLQALYAGVASIQAQQSRMNVIGDNLANVNTTAFKSSRVTFEDMIAQTIRGATSAQNGSGGTNPVQFGLGVTVGSTDTNISQGSLNATGRNTDLALQGNGFFMVTNGSGVSYTRDGGFGLDSQGFLVQNSTGQRLMGWQADGQGTIDSTKPLSPSSALQVPIGSLNAVQVTTSMSVVGNLNAAAASTDKWDTQVQVFDSLGGTHTITLEFTNKQSPPTTAGAPANATSEWQWQAYEGTSASGTPIGGSTTGGNSPLYFDGNGTLINPLPAGTFNTVTVPAAGGAPSFPVSVDFGDLTQLNSISSASVKNPNGFAPGSLQSFSIGVDGTISGVFSNGLTRPIGQIAMSIFPNPEALQRVGNNLWIPTNNTGTATVGQPNQGGYGSISSGFLEQSNVDEGSEFTNLIVTERGFQANTKVVTTVDQMLQDLINMKQ